ncbi:chloramphenicol resistance protein [Patellaria atrata CBS 101060]|uniref:Chloramphenicol resistance protein n=1 Tax=Patellaria atrata CBS 101060 TaxID=1346257 RepID=A0A9P4S652_9PEZI|nr:chloramphenicol resistance protein [Patellaria atrata CBS 101060]
MPSSSGVIDEQAFYQSHSNLILSKAPLHQENTTDDAIREEQCIKDLEKSSTTTSAPVYSIFSTRQKQLIVFFVAFGGTFSPLSGNIYFPALNSLSRELHVSSSMINLTLTTYMIFQGLAPTFFGDFADMAGRRPPYVIGFIIYISANIGIALQNSYVALLILRCLQSTGSSGTIALGTGVVADISTSAERGRYIGWSQAGMMLGPSIGPVLGGVLAQFLGWRSIFWFLVILTAVYLVPFLILFPETGRNIVGNGSIPPQGWNMSLLNYLKTRKARKEDIPSRALSEEASHASVELASKRRLRFPNPLNTLHLVAEKNVGLLLFYNSLTYVGFMDVAASLPYLLKEIYQFTDLQVGLSYLPFGFGALIGTLVTGYLVDWNYRRVAKSMGIPIDRKRGDDLKNIPIELIRIQVAIPLIIVGAAALVGYGWAMAAETSLAVPLILLFALAVSLNGSFAALNTMLIDLYPLSPSTAMAANNLVRCLMGAAGTALIIDMIQGMGRGWCFTFLAAMLIIGSPILWVLVTWGPQWRERRRVRMEEKKRIGLKPVEGEEKG